MNINKHDAKTEIEMDMTPMIDVVFLLIIFFMIITDLTQQDLEELKLPEARAAVEGVAASSTSVSAIMASFSGLWAATIDRWFWVAHPVGYRS